MDEVAPDQRFIIHDGGKQGVLAEVGGEIAGEILSFLGLHVFRVDVPDLSRELDVFHETLVVPLVELAIERQSLVEDVGLERVVHRAEFRDECPEAIEVGDLFLEVVAEVNADGGAELADIDVDEAGVVEDLGFELEEGVELVEQEVAVDGQRAKAGVVAVGQVAGDKLGEVVVIGADEAGEQFVEPFIGEVGGNHEVESGVFESAEGLGALGQGAGGEGFAADVFGVEGGGGERPGGRRFRARGCR